MLDQNTDRTWWMIGAVVVGALLIGAAMIMFPEIFDIVKGKFTELINGVKVPTTS